MTSDNWVTIISAVVGGGLVAIGWFVTGHVNRTAEIAKRRLDYRLKMLESFLPVWFAIQQNKAPFAVAGFLEQLRIARSNFLLYGYQDEIGVMERFINAVESDNLRKANEALDELVPMVRTRIRGELRIDA